MFHKGRRYRPEAVEVRRPAEGPVDHRPCARRDVHPEIDERDHDVGEEHGGVYAVAPHWLHRQLGCQLRVADGVQDAARPSLSAVLRERAPRLAHEPDRRVRHRFSLAGSQEWRRARSHANTVIRRALQEWRQPSKVDNSGHMAHPELPAEQSYLDKAYERLEAVRAATLAELAEAFQERGGTFQSYTERDIRVRNSLSRLEKLQLGREALIFGRIDRPAGETGAGDGAVGRPSGAATAGAEGTCGHAAAEESFHIGRLAISDAEHEPLVVDWRAPVAEPFYRATGANPMGLRRRRHFLSAGRRILDLEDELFVPGGPERVAETLGLPGSSVLRAALERAHTGRMRDIVATVQAEQDAIIRAPLPGALVVQGGPGTGKTAVALHRAAYLLYTHRFPLESQGVLVIGAECHLPALHRPGPALARGDGRRAVDRERPVQAGAPVRLGGGRDGSPQR